MASRTSTKKDRTRLKAVPWFMLDDASQSATDKRETLLICCQHPIFAPFIFVKGQASNRSHSVVLELHMVSFWQQNLVASCLRRMVSSPSVKFTSVFMGTKHSKLPQKMYTVFQFTHSIKTEHLKLIFTYHLSFASFLLLSHSSSQFL